MSKEFGFIKELESLLVDVRYARTGKMDQYEVCDFVERMIAKHLRKTYLGDSVHTEFDGYVLILTTENDSVGDPSNIIFIEPEVWENLLNYMGKGGQSDK